jgi:hypothetical protein
MVRLQIIHRRGTMLMKDLPDDDVEFTIIGTEQLAVDLRDAVLTQIKHLRKPWQQMSEGEQYETANGLEQVARHLVHNAVMVIADRGFPSLLVKLPQVTIKADDIECRVRAPHTDESRAIMGGAAGGTVMLVVADAAEFFGSRPATIDPDQPNLGFETAGDPEEDPDDDDPDDDDPDDLEPDEEEPGPDQVEEPGADPEEVEDPEEEERPMAAVVRRRGRPRKSQADALS